MEIRKTRTTKVCKKPSDAASDDLLDSALSGKETEDWVPERKTKGRRKVGEGTAETSAKRTVRRKVPKTEAMAKSEALNAKETIDYVKEEKHSDGYFEHGESLPLMKVKRKRQVSNIDSMMDTEGSSSKYLFEVKKEEQEDDFTFEEPEQKKQKTTNMTQSTSVKQKSSNSLGQDLQMNWDPIQVLAATTGVNYSVCGNIAQLLRDENTIPFIVRYRKELINHMDADAVREVQLALEELCSVAKKSQSIRQTLKKEGVLTNGLEQALMNCKNADELDHLYTPFKKGSKLSKARKAKELGLESAALALLKTPQTLDLRSWVKPDTEGLSTVEEVATGVQQILADMIAKDGETLAYIRSLCDRSDVTIKTTVCKKALKEHQEKQHVVGQKSKPKDISKFSLYYDFSCSIKRIQHHQTLAINRGESMKFLSVKINIPDWVRTDFCRWCANIRWRPQGYAQPQLMEILNTAVEDSYRRLLTPLLSRGYRSKLTTSAEKESVAMFVSNLRQRLLVCPVRGRVIMGIDPGYRHGCKLAILSPTSQILHTDVAYLHGPGRDKEADKLRHLMLKHSCQTVAIGNGTACKETQSFFADLIKRGFFKPLDVSYCVTNEAGASIYSVSPEAVKEMPDLDPNLRSAVSIGRRVQDPLAELVKIDPKHIGIGTYQCSDESGTSHSAPQRSVTYAFDPSVKKQRKANKGRARGAVLGDLAHEYLSGNFTGPVTYVTDKDSNHDITQRLLKAALDGVVQECVSFVGVDINTCSETLMRHVAGLNAGRARSIAEWREKNGPFLNRQQLKLVKGLGPKSFQQCAGFIRINPEAVRSYKSSTGSTTDEKTVATKKKAKSSCDTSNQPNPLDQTCIHPESYDITLRFLSQISSSLDQVGSPELRHGVENYVKEKSLEFLALSLGTCPETLQLIVEGVTKSPGFDIRQDFKQVEFNKGIMSMSDLYKGMVLTGHVENTALFGTFVDIGVGRSGLVPKRFITQDKLPAANRSRGLLLGPGEQVEVRVIDVDLQRDRITLDLVKVL